MNESAPRRLADLRTPGVPEIARRREMSEAALRTKSMRRSDQVDQRNYIEYPVR